jgi:hypothetical protein
MPCDLCCVQDAEVVDATFDTFKDYGGRPEIKDNVALDDLHESVAAFRAALLDGSTWLREQESARVWRVCWLVACRWSWSSHSRS